MPDLRVTHIIIRRQPHGSTMRLKLNMRILSPKHIQRRSISRRHRVSRVIRRHADSIHNNSKNRSLYPSKRPDLLKLSYPYSKFPFIYNSSFTRSVYIITRKFIKVKL